MHRNSMLPMSPVEWMQAF